MARRLDKETRAKAERLIRDIAESAWESLARGRDEQFFSESRGFAAGIARGVLLFGYRQDYDELMRLVDEVFKPRSRACGKS